MDNAEFQRLQDPDLPNGERQALVARHQNAFADLIANFDEDVIQTFVQRLGGSGFRRIYEIGNNDALTDISQVG